MDLDRLRGIQIGFNSGRWVQRETGPLREQAEALGLILPDGRAFARDCITVPLLDVDGQMVSLYGRSIKERGGKHFYQRGRQGLFPGYPPVGTRRVIITESVIDALSVMMLDLPEETAVLALYGTSGFTEEHRLALSRIESKSPDQQSGIEVTLCLDADRAGQQAAERLSALLTGRGHRLSVVDLSLMHHQGVGHDPNDVLREDGPEALAALLASATPLEPVEERPETEGSSSSPEDGPDSQGIPQTEGHLDSRDPMHLVFTSGAFRVTVRGGVQLDRLDRLRVAVVIEEPDSGKLPVRDRRDLYHRSDLVALARSASEDLDVSEHRMQTLLRSLADHLEHYRLGALEEAKASEEPRRRVLTEVERRDALKYVQSPDLMQQTLEDIGRSGVVGEETNRLLLYLVLTSRLRSKPLHAICLGASGTGKTYLQEMVARLIPEEDRIEVSALSENALYYFGRQELKHKALLIEDLDGLDGVLYPLRELQTKGRLSKSVPIKDARGRIQTQTIEVRGPVATCGCTTQEHLYEDNVNRALLLHLDHSADQEAAILKYQRDLSAGLIDRSAQHHIQRKLANVQRLLEPIAVHNPYANRLKLPTLVQKRLRSNALYLGLIETITFYHQQARPLKMDEHGRRYVETTLADIRWANRLIAPVLATKSDELSGACRRFFEELKTWMQQQKQTSFRAAHVRRAMRMSPARLQRYLNELRDYGLVEIVGGSRYRRGYEYVLTQEASTEHPGGAIETFLEHVVQALEPSGDGSAPSGDGSAPSGDGSAPSGDGSAPSGDGSAPGGDGSAPSGDGSSVAKTVLYVPQRASLAK